jgi:hypothetical protein
MPPLQRINDGSVHLGPSLVTDAVDPGPAATKAQALGKDDVDVGSACLSLGDRLAILEPTSDRAEPELGRVTWKHRARIDHQMRFGNPRLHPDPQLG